ncbi:MAG: AAA family ATPase, partial [Opitutae bacterium]|nr:AAA family ATPase [Opitutae bacterium]
MPFLKMENAAQENPLALTDTQHEICDALRNHALLHYGFLGDITGEAGLKPRCYPLLAGPTGAGKSMLVERVAHQLGAVYFRVTYGEWMPHGVREPAVPTMVRLARLLAKNSRVVVHVDELDKWISGAHEWGRSLSTDLWNLLDAKISWEQARALNPAAKEVPAGGTNLPAEETDAESFVPANFTRTEHMWIVGSGTWQDIFDRRAARAIGFRPKGAS